MLQCAVLLVLNAAYFRVECRRRFADRRNRVQPRYPSDPGGQVLQVSRARRQAAERQAAARHWSRPPRRRPARGAWRSCRGRSARASSTCASRPEDADERMPPEDSGKSLSAAEISLLKRWIEEGAVYEGHWAFTPPVRPELPAVKNRAWCRNPIDFFILAKLESNGLAPSPEAEQTTLLKRLSSRPGRACRRRSTRKTRSWPIAAASPMQGRSNGCWILRTTASAGGGSGSTPRVTPTRTATRKTSRARCISIATGSSAH